MTPSDNLTKRELLLEQICVLPFCRLSSIYSFCHCPYLRFNAIESFLQNAPTVNCPATTVSVSIRTSSAMAMSTAMTIVTNVIAVRISLDKNRYISYCKFILSHNYNIHDFSQLISTRVCHIECFAINIIRYVFEYNSYLDATI